MKLEKDEQIRQPCPGIEDTVAFTKRLEDAEIDQDIKQGVAMGDGSQRPLMGWINLERFRRTLETFDRGPLRVEPLIRRRLAIQPPAKQVAGFDIHFAPGVTDGTDKTLDRCMSSIHQVWGRISCRLHRQNG